MAGNAHKRDVKIRNFLAKANNPDFWTKFWEEVAALEKYDRRYREVLDKHKIPYEYYDDYLQKFPKIKEQERLALQKAKARDHAETGSRLGTKHAESVEERLDRGEVVEAREIDVAIKSNFEAAKMLDRSSYGDKQQVQVTNIHLEFMKALTDSGHDEPKVINPTNEIKHGNADDHTPGPRDESDRDVRDDVYID